MIAAGNKNGPQSAGRSLAEVRSRAQRTYGAVIRLLTGARLGTHGHDDIGRALVQETTLASRLTAVPGNTGERSDEPQPDPLLQLACVVAQPADLAARGPGVPLRACSEQGYSPA
jgi:hypothetical protein